MRCGQRTSAPRESSLLSTEVSLCLFFDVSTPSVGQSPLPLLILQIWVKVRVEQGRERGKGRIRGKLGRWGILG